MAEDIPWTWPLCPDAPAWEVQWNEILDAVPLLGPLANCVQDPVHHAEGNVLVHTRMVCEELVKLPRWRALSPGARSIVFLAALLHDCGKPYCTEIEETGRVTSRGHALKGTFLARAAIYRQLTAQLCIPPAIREQILALIRYHGLPLSFLNKPDPTRAVITASMSARCDWLALVAEADARGRICADQHQLIETVGLFEDFSHSLDVWNSPRRFESPHARFTYFTDGRSGESYVPFDTTKSRVVMMSGLPGAGKDHYIQTHLSDLEIISLDKLRVEMKVNPADDQGKVVAEAKERAMRLLRQNRSFVWNATNTTRTMRQSLAAIFSAYHASIDIVYIETDYRTLMHRNAGGRVPKQVIERLIDRLDPPDLTEAHRIHYG